MLEVVKPWPTPWILMMLCVAASGMAGCAGNTPNNTETPTVASTSNAVDCRGPKTYDGDVT